jgi:hypothetical protein
MTTQRTYRVTVTTPEGQPVFTVLITRERPEAPHPVPASPSPSPGPAAARPHIGPVSSGQPRLLALPRLRITTRIARSGRAMTTHRRAHDDPQESP